MCLRSLFEFSRYNIKRRQALRVHTSFIVPTSCDHFVSFLPATSTSTPAANLTGASDSSKIKVGHDYINAMDCKCQPVLCFPFSLRLVSPWLRMSFRYLAHTSQMRFKTAKLCMSKQHERKHHQGRTCICSPQKANTFKPFWCNWTL